LFSNDKKVKVYIQTASNPYNTDVCDELSVIFYVEIGVEVPFVQFENL